MTQMDIPISDVTRRVELEVTFSGVKVWQAKCIVAIWLIKIAARLIGCGVKFNAEGPQG